MLILYTSIEQILIFLLDFSKIEILNFHLPAKKNVMKAELNLDSEIIFTSGLPSLLNRREHRE